MLKFTTNQFTYQKDTKTFVEETSMLDLSRMDWNSLRHDPVEQAILLTNPKTGIEMIFYFSHADIQNDEAYGWNYVSDSNIKLLLIND